MTWELAGLLAAACSLFSLGFLLCAVVTAPLLPERVPDHLDLDALNAEWVNYADEVRAISTGRYESRPLTLVPPPAQFIDAEALGWLEGA